MNTRTVAIVLGVALAVSAAVNVFAGAAVYTAFAGQDGIGLHADGGRGDGHRGGPRELVGALSAGEQGRVRQSLREAGLAARPDFEEARNARRQAIAAAGVEPYDAARVAALLNQSRAAEIRGRQQLESDALVILGTLGPQDRAAFAQILNRGKGGQGGDRVGHGEKGGSDGHK